MDVEALIETWRGPLVGLFAGWGAPWSDATELAQDTLVEAYLARGRLRGDATDPEVVGPWLRGIARNLHRAWQRRRGRRREESLALDPPVETRAEDVRLEALRAQMARLPEKLRTVLYLRYLEQSGVREVACLLGLSEKTVEGRLYQARQALRAALVDVPSLTTGEDLS